MLSKAKGSVDAQARVVQIVADKSACIKQAINSTLCKYLGYKWKIMSAVPKESLDSIIILKLVMISKITNLYLLTLFMMA